MSGPVMVTEKNVGEVVDKLRNGELPPGKCAPPPLGSVRLWHPSAAVQVTLPVCGGSGPQFDYALALANVSAALAAGWLASAPGLEAGENRDDCGWVVRSQKDGRTGTAEVIDLYLPDDKFAKVRLYLNTPDEVAEFERVSGLTVAKLPLYIGANKIERGKSKQTDTLVCRVPKPFGFVWKDNPDHNPDEQDATKKKPKRLFVRWADGAPPAGSPQAAQACGSRQAAGGHADSGERGAGRPEVKTPADLAGEYPFCHDDDTFEYLEHLRAKFWQKASRDEQASMKAAAEACRKRMFEGEPVGAGR